MRIFSFLQTPFISYDDKNMVYISVADWDMCNPYEAKVFVGGELVFSKQVFAPEFSAMIPCYDKECVATVSITPFEDTPTQREFTIVPSKIILFFPRKAYRQGRRNQKLKASLLLC